MCAVSLLSLTARSIKFLIIELKLKHSVYSPNNGTPVVLFHVLLDRDIDMFNAEWMQVVNVDYMFKEGDDVADMSDFIKLNLNKD